MDHSRYSVEKYPVKCIFIDLSHPWTRGISENVSLALMRFFATASNVIGSSRIPALSLVVIGIQSECIFPLQAMKVNTARLMRVLHEVKVQDGLELHEKAFQENLSDAVKQVFNQFSRSFYANKQQHWSSLTQIEACFITCQQQNFIESCLGQAFKEQELEYLKKIQIIHVKDTCEESPMLIDKSSDHEWNPGNFDELHDYLEFVTVANDTTEIEFALKPWLIDYSTDDVQVIIDINGIRNLKGIKLKCDLSDRLLRLSMVPSYQLKLFQMPSHQAPCHHCQSPMANAITNANAFHFHVTQLIHISGICESVVYGQPLIIRPTSCWKLDWEELDLNQQKFQAVRSFLLQQELCMLLESKETSVNTPKTFCIMLPSSGCGMLLKCVANSDVLLPLPNSLCIQKESEEIQSEVQTLLLEVPKTSIFNPLRLKAGISDKLLEVFESNESKRNARGVPRNPYTSRNPTTKSIMEVKPRNLNSSASGQDVVQTAKKAKINSKSFATKGSIFAREPPEFPQI